MSESKQELAALTETSDSRLVVNAIIVLAPGREEYITTHSTIAKAALQWQRVSQLYQCSKCSEMRSR